MNTPFLFPVRVYYEDTDAGGVVYHANYLKFLERARTEWAERKGYGMAWQQQQACFFVVAKVSIDYLVPARLGDHLEIVTELCSRKRVSMVFKQIIRLASARDVILCSAEVVVVAVNQHIKPVRLPKLLLDCDAASR
jgi:acyl-CoA thioester hydrolase